jgi:hypothetical protein
VWKCRPVTGLVKSSSDPIEWVFYQIGPSHGAGLAPGTESSNPEGSPRSRDRGGVADEDVRFKRSVSIVIANASLLLLELMNGPVSSRTHPPIEERIDRNLRGPELETDDRIHAFATALIQFNLAVVGIRPVLEEHDQFGHFLDDFCLAINRWRRSA